MDTESSLWMDVINELNREELLHLFKLHRDFAYIQMSIRTHSHCYLVSVDHNDLGGFLLNSSPKHPELPLNQYPNIIKVLDELIENPTFLDVPPAEGYRGVNGVTVKEKLAGFRSGNKLEDCFIEDAWQEMEREGAYYIVDGMHRLVAYALWSNLNAEKFPIRAYCCTNKRLQSLNENRTNI
jgi:hypothetical protein